MVQPILKQHCESQPATPTPAFAANETQLSQQLLKAAQQATAAGSPEHADYLSPQAFAAVNGLSLATVRRYVADGRLPAFQPGGYRCRVLIHREALAQLGRATPQSPTPSMRKPVRKHVADPRPNQSLSGPAPRWRSDSKRSSPHA